MEILAQPIEALTQGFNNLVTNLSDFFTNLISSLSQWFSDVLNNILNIGTIIRQSFTNLFDNVSQWITNIINNILDLKDNIINLFNQIFEKLREIINYLNPLHEKFFLKLAFIPSEGYFEDFINDIKTVINNKFSFISEIENFLNTIFNVVIDNNPSPPDFTINLPRKWGNKEVRIIDFSIFDQYRTFILNFIRVTLWIPFIIKVYKRLPSVIY